MHKLTSLEAQRVTSVLEDTLTTLTLRPTNTADDGGTVQQIRILSVTGGTLTANDGTAITLGDVGRRLDLVDGAVSLKFTPSADSTTTASIRYVLVDPVDATLNSAASTFTVPITAVNDAPVGADDTVTVAEDNAATGNVLTNDSDVDTGTTLAVTQFTVFGDATVYTAGQTATLASSQSR